MTALAHPNIGPSLASIYPPYAEAMADYERLAAKDMREAEKAYARVQTIAKAWYAAINYAIQTGAAL